jgi:hypothetical protein
VESPEELAASPLGLLLARVLGEQHEPMTLTAATRAVRVTGAPRAVVAQHLLALVRLGFAEVKRGRYVTACVSNRS